MKEQTDSNERNIQTKKQTNMEEQINSKKRNAPTKKQNERTDRQRGKN